MIQRLLILTVSLMHINQKIREALFFPTVKDNSDTLVLKYITWRIHLYNDDIKFDTPLTWMEILNFTHKENTQRKDTVIEWLRQGRNLRLMRLL